MDEDVKKVLLDLLLKLDEVCERHGLVYYIAYGTCLGALRHKGFIPWDHDIDVLMPIADARKLVQYQEEFGERYFVQCKDTDPEFGYITYKLRDSETACIWNKYRDCRFNQGLNIDIYPFYEAPKTKAGLLINIWRSHILRVLTIEDMPMRHTGAVRLMKNMLLKVFRDENRTRMRKHLQKKLESARNGNEILDYFGLDITLFSAITYPKEWFGTPRRVEFEGYLVNAPAEAEKYMTKRYGDYMTLPPESERVSGFFAPGAVIDAHKSYRDYYKEWDK